MATSARTMEILLEHLSDIPTIRARKMFGEYAVYVEDKVVGFVCDDRLLLKITPASKSRVRTQAMGKPYPGAKDYYRIDEHDWDNREYITELVTATADSLPAPKLKQPKVSGTRLDDRVWQDGSMNDLREIPGIGRSLAADLKSLGYTEVQDLRGENPEEMYDRLQTQVGAHVDRCVLYNFRCAVYYAEGGREPDKLKWWSWKDNT